MTREPGHMRIVTACGVVSTLLLSGPLLAERDTERDGEHLRREHREQAEREELERREQEEREHRRVPEDEGDWEGGDDWDGEEEEWVDEDWGGHRMAPSTDSILEELMRRFREEDRDRALGMVRELFPGAFHEFENLVRRRPGEAEAMMDRLLDEVAELMELRRRAPERFELVVKTRRLEAESEELGELYRRSEGERRERTKAELRKILGQIFEIKQELTDAEIRDVAAELEKLKQRAEKRQANREAIVERRLEQITGEDEVFEW